MHFGRVIGYRVWRVGSPARESLRIRAHVVLRVLVAVDQRLAAQRRTSRLHTTSRPWGGISVHFWVESRLFQRRFAHRLACEPGRSGYHPPHCHSSASDEMACGCPLSGSPGKTWIRTPTPSPAMNPSACFQPPSRAMTKASSSAFAALSIFACTRARTRRGRSTAGAVVLGVLMVGQRSFASLVGRACPCCVCAVTFSQ